MSVRDAFRGLERAVAELEDAVAAVRCTVVEDEPSPSHAIATGLGDAIEDLDGWLHEAAEAVRAGARGVPEGSGSGEVWRALELSQELVNHMYQRLSDDLLAYDVLDQLSRLGRERGKEWMSWSETVRRGLDQVQSGLHAVSGALLACWREIAERNASTWVSVNATNIGQQVNARAEELAQHGFT